MTCMIDTAPVANNQNALGHLADHADNLATHAVTFWITALAEIADRRPCFDKAEKAGAFSLPS